MAAHQAPLSLGFSRQEHWSGLPFPSPMHESEIAHSCPTLSNPMDCSLPGSSAHGIFQARVLEWGAIAFSASCQIEGEKVEAVTDFLFSGSQITVDDDCSHEIKRWFLLWKKAMTNLDSILSGSITLPTKVCTVKTMGFPVVMYRCENWTIKKAEHRITDAFKCDAFKRRLFWIPWITRRSNQSILKEIKVMRWLEKSPTQWTWIWANFGRFEGQGFPTDRMLQSMGLQSVEHSLVMERQQHNTHHWEWHHKKS